MASEANSLAGREESEARAMLMPVLEARNERPTTLLIQKTPASTTDPMESFRLSILREASWGRAIFSESAASTVPDHSEIGPYLGGLQVIAGGAMGLGFSREGCRPMDQKCRRARSVAVRCWSVNPNQMGEGPAVASNSSRTVGSASCGCIEALFLSLQPTPPDSALIFQLNCSGKEFHR
jgi:hypothetical protein